MRNTLSLLSFGVLAVASSACFSLGFDDDAYDDDTPPDPPEPPLGEPWDCDADCEIAEIDAGGYLLDYGSTCVRTRGGEVVCWGNAGLFADSGDWAVPSRLAGVSDAAELDVAGRHGCIVRAHGTAWCWGPAYDPVVDGDLEVSRGLQLVPVAGLGDVVQIASGAGHSCALHADGQVTCWGDGPDGQLGREDAHADGEYAVAIPDLTGVTELAAGLDHTCALRDGDVLCWGANDVGQLGSSGGDTFAPSVVEDLGEVVSIGAGGTGTCAVLSDGAVSCWGFIGPGRSELDFGSGPPSPCQDSPTWTCDGPTRIEGLSAVSRVVVGKEHACALTEGGELRCWGSNRAGQLGDGTTEDRPAPIVVPGLDDIAFVAAGRLHTCAVTRDGQVQCWGDDEHHQLGLRGEAPDACVDIGGNLYPCATSPQLVRGFGG